VTLFFLPAALLLLLLHSLDDRQGPEVRGIFLPPANYRDFEAAVSTDCTAEAARGDLRRTVVTKDLLGLIVIFQLVSVSFD
jgi:hypothetical protein